MKKVKFTGEYFVPGAAGTRLEEDHVTRYFFASAYVAGKRVLDLACGEGYGSKILLGAGAASYTGIDINSNLIDAAIAKYGSLGAVFKVGDIANLNLKDKFDVIVCFETIEHIPFYKEALEQLHQHLKPEGCLLISSPNRPVTSPRAYSLSDPPKNKYHTQEFTPQELMKLLSEAGFDADSFEVFGQRLSFFHFKNFLIRATLRILCLDPSFIASSKVKPYKYKTPRYFVVLARL